MRQAWRIEDTSIKIKGKRKPSSASFPIFGKRVLRAREWPVIVAGGSEQKVGAKEAFLTKQKPRANNLC